MPSPHKIRVDLEHEIPVPGPKDGPELKVKYIEIGRPKVKHLKLLPKDIVEKKGELEAHEMIPLIAGLSGLPLESIEEIDLLTDLPKVAEKVQLFLGGSPAAGKKASGA